MLQGGKLFLKFWNDYYFYDVIRAKRQKEIKFT